MRLTASQLRRIVREEVLRESRLKDLFDKVKDDPRADDGKPFETRVPRSSLPPNQRMRYAAITVKREFTEYVVYLPSENPDEVRVLRGRVKNDVLGDTNSDTWRKVLRIVGNKGAMSWETTYDIGTAGDDPVKRNKPKLNESDDSPTDEHTVMCSKLWKIYTAMFSRFESPISDLGAGNEGAAGGEDLADFMENKSVIAMAAVANRLEPRIEREAWQNLFGVMVMMKGISQKMENGEDVGNMQMFLLPGVMTAFSMSTDFDSFCSGLREFINSKTRRT
jgi:hypothetical protein